MCLAFRSSMADEAPKKTDEAPKKTRNRSELGALDNPVVVSGKRLRTARSASPSLSEVELAQVGGASSGTGNNASGSNQYGAHSATGYHRRDQTAKANQAKRSSALDNQTSSTPQYRRPAKKAKESATHRAARRKQADAEQLAVCKQQLDMLEGFVHSKDGRSAAATTSSSSAAFISLPPSSRSSSRTSRARSRGRGTRILFF